MTQWCSTWSGPCRPKLTRDTINLEYHGTIHLKNGEISSQSIVWETNQLTRTLTLIHTASVLEFSRILKDMNYSTATGHPFFINMWWMRSIDSFIVLRTNVRWDLPMSYKILWNTMKLLRVHLVNSNLSLDYHSLGMLISLGLSLIIDVSLILIL